MLIILRPSAKLKMPSEATTAVRVRGGPVPRSRRGCTGRAQPRSCASRHAGTVSEPVHGRHPGAGLSGLPACSGQPSSAGLA